MMLFFYVLCVGRAEIGQLSSLVGVRGDLAVVISREHSPTLGPVATVAMMLVGQLGHHVKQRTGTSERGGFDDDDTSPLTAVTLTIASWLFEASIQRQTRDTPQAGHVS